MLSGNSIISLCKKWNFLNLSWPWERRSSYIQENHLLFPEDLERQTKTDRLSSTFGVKNVVYFFPLLLIEQIRNNISGYPSGPICL